MVSPPKRTGMHRVRTGSPTSTAVRSASMISPSSQHRNTSERSDAGSTEPTRSVRYSVWLVSGRTWPSTTSDRPVTASPRASERVTGTKSNRSAKHRSASRPHVATSRCRWVTAGSGRVVCSRVISAVVAISPPSRWAVPPGQWSARQWSAPYHPAHVQQPGQIEDVAVEVRRRRHHLGNPGQLGTLFGLT